MDMDIPANDNRLYKHVTLASNGLKCLLISDAETEKAACAVSVKVGQMQDFLPGLAHLTEHMLTMGSETFPGENEVNQYLAKAGGHTNAFTDLELTCYYFDCSSSLTPINKNQNGNGKGDNTDNNENESKDVESPTTSSSSGTYFQGSLERFGAAFESPLFQLSTVERELQAVDSEHQGHLNEDHWCMHNLVRVLMGGHCHTAAATTTHPYSSFGTGCKESLAKHGYETLQQEVMRFYKQYYTANNMACVLLGKESLEELEAYATKYFSVVRPGSLENLPQPLPAFQPKLPLRVNVVPVSDHTTLHCYWPLPETWNLYLTKPTRTVSHLLGHEGPGSLLSLLRDRQWAHELMADDASKSYSNFTIFEVQIELSPLGLEHVDQVVKLMYAYLSLLQDELPQYVYEELQATADMQFRFLSKTYASDTASSLAVSLHHYAPAHVLSGPHKLWEFSPQKIKEFCQLLRPDNMMMVVSAKELEPTTDQVSEWYGTKYKIITEQQEATDCVKEWTRALEKQLGDEDDGAWKELHLPELNNMLATNFDLVPKEKLPKVFHVEKVATLEEEGKTATDDGATAAVEQQQPAPFCLVNSPTCRLWYKPDTAFSMPKVNIMITLRTSLVYVCSAYHSVLASLWVELVRERCNDFAYAASMAGLHCDFNNTKAGMEIHVSGYNHKAGILLQRIVDTISTLSGLGEESKKVAGSADAPGNKKEDDTLLVDELFHRIVDKLAKQFAAFLVAQTYQHSMYAADLCLEDCKWTVQDKIDALGSATKGDLLQFANQLLHRFHMEAFVHGNVTPQEAIGFADIVLNAWKPKAPLDLRDVRVAQLTGTIDTFYRIKSYNPEGLNNSITNIYQIGPLTLRENSILSLLQHLMREPAFNQLRTEEQLGYVIHTGVKTSGDTVKGVMFIIQGDTFDPIHMNERVEDFLKNFRVLVAEMSEEEFQANVEAVYNNLTEKNKNLGEESMKHWNVISNQTYDFRRLEKIGEHVMTLSKSDVLVMFDKYMLAGSPDRRKLSAQVFGKKHIEKLEQAGKGGEGQIFIQNPSEYVRGQPLYPVVSKTAIAVSELMLEL